jgi:hypothetical protein
MSEQQPSLEHLQHLYTDVFETDARGAAIFEDLYRKFVRGQQSVVTSGGIDAVLKTYQCAAHRQVLDYITKMCNAGRGVYDAAPTPQEPDDVHPQVLPDL